MTAPFAALETRVNAAVFKHLANAEGTLGGQAVSGIYRAPYQMDELTGGVAGSAPEFDLLSSLVPANVTEQPLVLTGIGTFKVVEPMADGTGVTTLRLRA